MPFLALGTFGLFFIIVLLAILFFEVFMFVHVIRNRGITDNTRLLWAIGMLLLHPFIAIAYYFTDYKKAS